MNSLDKAFQALVEHGVSYPLAAYLVNLESRVIALEAGVAGGYLASAVAPNREAGAVTRPAGTTAAEVKPEEDAGK